MTDGNYLLLTPAKIISSVQGSNGTGLNFKLSTDVLKEYRGMTAILRRRTALMGYGGIASSADAKEKNSPVLEPLNREIRIRRNEWALFYPLLSRIIERAYAGQIFKIHGDCGYEDLNRFFASDSFAETMRGHMKNDRFERVVNGIPFVVLKRKSGFYDIHDFSGRSLSANVFIERDQDGPGSRLVFAFSYVQGKDRSILQKLDSKCDEQQLRGLVERAGAKLLCFGRFDVRTVEEQTANWLDALIALLPVEIVR